MDTDKSFLIDSSAGKRYSYQTLMTDINRISAIPRFLYTKSLYEFYCILLASMIHGQSIEVLDGDLSMQELEKLEIRKEMLERVIAVPCAGVSVEDLIAQISTGGSPDWTITLYTSGTTGRPKKVRHRLGALTRTVKRSDKLADKVWALAYNPTHYAGLQVFFQALLNLNTIVYIFTHPIQEIPYILKEHHITNLSATPSYYKMLLPLMEENTIIERLTFGGERMDLSVLPEVHRVFPRAVVRNIYASTEAGALFSSADDDFELSPEMRDKVKILDTGELVLRRSLLSEGDSLGVDEWFRTGDLVEPLGNYKFRFVSRETEMINVGGYKVNPNEVEEIIRQIDGIADVLVTGKENRLLGNVLLAYIVKEDDKTDENVLKNRIITTLSKTLQKWKCPRIFYFVPRLELSRTGKKVRRQCKEQS